MKKVAAIFSLCAMVVTLASAQTIKGTYAIKNVQNGMLLRIKDANGKNGTPLVSYYPENWKCMTWDFKHTGGNIYQLQNLFTHKTFQPKASAAVDVPLEEQPFKADTAVQQYEFEQVAENVYMIRLKNTDLYVTPSDKNGAVNSQVVLAKKTTGKYQQWSIYQQSPTM